MKLYNNGYFIKGFTKTKWSSIVEQYKKIDNSVVWPFQFEFDEIAVKLDDEAWEKWFGYEDTLLLVPKKDYLIRYVEHCKKLGIDTQIIQVETPKINYFDSDYLEIIEVLGFDCIETAELSYMSTDREYIKKEFGYLYYKLNSNGLFDNIDDAYAFLNKYNQLLADGANLEYGNDVVPARLSIVKL